MVFGFRVQEVVFFVPFVIFFVLSLFFGPEFVFFLFCPGSVFFCSVFDFFCPLTLFCFPDIQFFLSRCRTRMPLAHVDAVLSFLDGLWSVRSVHSCGAVTVPVDASVSCLSSH